MTPGAPCRTTRGHSLCPAAMPMLNCLVGHAALHSATCSLFAGDSDAAAPRAHLSSCLAPSILGGMCACGSALPTKGNRSHRPRCHLAPRALETHCVPRRGLVFSRPVGAGTARQACPSRLRGPSGDALPRQNNLWPSPRTTGARPHAAWRGSSRRGALGRARTGLGACAIAASARKGARSVSASTDFSSSRPGRGLGGQGGPCRAAQSRTCRASPLCSPRQEAESGRAV